MRSIVRLHVGAWLKIDNDFLSSCCLILWLIIFLLIIGFKVLLKQKYYICEQVYKNCWVIRCIWQIKVNYFIKPITSFCFYVGHWQLVHGHMPYFSILSKLCEIDKLRWSKCRSSTDACGNVLSAQDQLLARVFHLRRLRKFDDAQKLENLLVRLSRGLLWTEYTFVW